MIKKETKQCCFAIFKTTLKWKRICHEKFAPIHKLSNFILYATLRKKKFHVYRLKHIFMYLEKIF